ncbi:hypothetical protein Tco_0906170, partial [Tanacetum coccineum]
MSTYLKNMAGYKRNQLKRKSYDEIQEMIDKEMKRVNTFVDMNTELVKGSKTKAGGSSKRAGNELEQEKAKKQKADDDQEEAEMKRHIEIVKDDEVAIDAIPLATKPPMIVDYKIDKYGRMGYLKLIRADGISKRYSSMIKMLQEDDYERMLWGDLKNMFEPDIKSDVWTNLQGYKVTVWKLFDNRGVHFGRIIGIKRLLEVTTARVNVTAIKNGPNWLFDIDALTKSMNYMPVVTGNQTNGNTGTKENIDAGQARKHIVLDQEYTLLPLLTSDPSLSKSLKDSPYVGFKPSGEEEKIDAEHPKNEDSEVPNTEEPRVNQEHDANVNSTNNINTVSPTVSVADIENNAVDENIVYRCIDDPNMPNLEEIVYSDDDEEVGAEADMNNLATNVPVSPIPTTRVHKDHPLEQIIGDIHLTPQTRRMTKNVTAH